MGQIGLGAIERKLQAAQGVGLGFFLTVFEASNRFAAQAGRIRQLAKAKAEALACLSQTTEFQCHTSSSR